MKPILVLLTLYTIAFSGEIVAYYTPSCSCCVSYFSKLEREGFRIRKEEKSPEELMKIKSQLRIPPQVRSCHTVVVEGRFVEGHVPPEGIRKLLKEKDFRGVASTHGRKSAMGGFEESYYLVKENYLKEVKP